MALWRENHAGAGLPSAAPPCTAHAGDPRPATPKPVVFVEFDVMVINADGPRRSDVNTALAINTKTKTKVPRNSAATACALEEGWRGG
jgi:hypothetical protein